MRTTSVPCKMLTTFQTWLILINNNNNKGVTDFLLNSNFFLADHIMVIIINKYNRDESSVCNRICVFSYRNQTQLIFPQKYLDLLPIAQGKNLPHWPCWSPVIVVHRIWASACACLAHQYASIGNPLGLRFGYCKKTLRAMRRLLLRFWCFELAMISLLLCTSLAQPFSMSHNSYFLSMYRGQVLSHSSIPIMPPCRNSKSLQ